MCKQETRERARRMIVRALLDKDPDEIDWSDLLAVVSEETGVGPKELEEEKDKILDIASISP